jgi:hypothetical protein
MATGVTIVARPYISRLENVVPIDPARNKPATAMIAAPVRLADDLHINYVIGMHDRAALDQRHCGSARTDQPNRYRKCQFLQVGFLLMRVPAVASAQLGIHLQAMDSVWMRKFSQCLTSWELGKAQTSFGDWSGAGVCRVMI